MTHLLRVLLKRLFNSVGLEIRRKTAHRNTLAEILRHLTMQGFSPRTVIDVGVAQGTYELYEAFPESKFILVEPLREFEDALRKIARQHDAQVAIAAAGDKAGTMRINVHHALQGSSLLKEVEGLHVDGVPREVPVVTIDDLCNGNLQNSPYLLKIDVQGGELLVLDGAKKTLEQTEVVILEVHLFQFFVSGPQLHDVVIYMKERGFCVYDIFGFHYRPLDQALGSVDIVFVKDRGLFRKTHNYATYEQRQKLEDG